MSGEEPKKTWKQKVMPYLWDSLDKSPAEKKLLFKIDCFIMTYICLGYFMRTIDQTNIANAYVSGMQEDLNIKGNQYILLTTFFTIGYCIFQIPSQFLIIYIRPSIWLPTCELLWGVCVFGMAGAKNVQTLYLLRFLVGVFESSSYPGCISMLSSWYTPEELGKRALLFQSSIAIASMFSGYLQAGLKSGMDGRNGLAAWRWLFIFDGILTVFVVIIGYLFVPDTPTDTKLWFLTEEEKVLAVKRIVKIKRAPILGVRKQHIKRIFTNWPVYLFTLGLTCQILGIRVTSYFNLWLKSTGEYTVRQINLIPTGAYGLELVVLLLYAWISDGLRNRCVVIIGAMVPAIVGAGLLSGCMPHSYNDLIFAGWFLLFVAPPVSALWVIWLNEVVTYSAEERAIILGIAEAISFAMVAWIPLLLWPSTDAPHYKYGYEILLMFLAMEIVTLLLIAYLFHRDKTSGKQAKLEERGMEEAKDVINKSLGLDADVELYKEKLEDKEDQNSKETI